MAIKPKDSNEAFYREVDEELRKDQLGTVWKRHGWLIVGGIVLFLAAIGGFIWWQNYREAKAGEQGEALVAALENVEQKRGAQAAEPIDRLSKGDSEAYRAAALFTRANVAVEAGNTAAAIAALKSVAEDDGLAEPYRQAALVRQTALEYDSLTPAVIIQRLGPYARAGHPWFGSAGEMVAIAHLRQQQPQRAAPIFSALARDETVPPSIRSRAVQMAGALGVDAVQQTPATGGGGTAAPQGQAATKGSNP